jgi:hypothetical protein
MRVSSFFLYILSNQPLFQFVLFVSKLFVQVFIVFKSILEYNVTGSQKFAVTNTVAI